ncbi:MAG TPA: hypothetical protein VGL56_19655 [Fimbriimonadaceae bacterium]|jgi:hypothetical protein
MAERNITEDVFPSLSNPGDRFKCFCRLFDWIDWVDAMRHGAPSPLNLQAFEESLGAVFVHLPTAVGLWLANADEAELFEVLARYISREVGVQRKGAHLELLLTNIGLGALVDARQLRGLIMSVGIPSFALPE